MKKYFFTDQISSLVWILLIFTAVAQTAYADRYEVDATHSSVGFTVKHLLVSDVDGIFTDYDTTFEMVKSDIKKFNLDVTATSVDTQNQKRDAHLRDEFFDIKKHPKITFRQTGYKASGSQKGKLTGDLTINDVTKKVVLDTTIAGPNQYRGKEIYGIKITGKVNRYDFKIGEGFPAVVVANEVAIEVNLQVKK